MYFIKNALNYLQPYIIVFLNHIQPKLYFKFILSIISTEEEEEESKFCISRRFLNKFLIIVMFIHTKFYEGFIKRFFFITIRFQVNSRNDQFILFFVPFEEKSND